jgi:hypothetical protein
MYSHKKPFTCRFSSLLVILFGLAMAIFAHQVMADDYFNPALLDIDNPQQEKPIYPSMKKAQVRRRVNIRLRCLSIIIKLIPAMSPLRCRKTIRATARCNLALTWTI